MVQCSYCGDFVSQDYVILPDNKFGCFCKDCMEKWEKEYFYDYEFLND